MLVLTRRKNEQLVITLDNQTVLVRILEVSHDRVPRRDRRAERGRGASRGSRTPNRSGKARRFHGG